MAHAETRRNGHLIVETVSVANLLRQKDEKKGKTTLATKSNGGVSVIECFVKTTLEAMGVYVCAEQLSIINRDRTRAKAHVRRVRVRPQSETLLAGEQTYTHTPNKPLTH